MPMVVGGVRAESVKVAEQLPLTSVQSMGEKLPLTFAEKCTLPVGVIGAPVVSESVTVTVQVVLSVGRIGEGEQSTETVTDLVVAVTPIGVAVPP